MTPQGEGGLKKVTYDTRSKELKARQRKNRILRKLFKLTKRSQLEVHVELLKKKFGRPIQEHRSSQQYFLMNTRFSKTKIIGYGRMASIAVITAKHQGLGKKKEQAQ